VSIPVKQLISVTPSVSSGGGTPETLNGVILSQYPFLPVGQPVSFPNLAAVLAYFGSYACSFTGTCVANTLTVTQTISGALAVGQQLQGAQAVGVPPGTVITALGTYSSVTGTGTVTISGPGFTQASASAMTSNCLEYQMAQVYFAGFTIGTQTPSALIFSRYATTACAAFLVGTTSVLTLAQIQAITTGTLSVTVNGTVVSIAALNLSTATSFSNAATLIQTAFAFTGGTAGTTVTWSSLYNAFVITSGTTGATSTMTYATGTLAATLGLASGNAGTLSQGSAAMTPAAAMTALIAQTSNWAGFTTAFEPVDTDKQAFSTWTASYPTQFYYAPYTTDATILTSVYTGFGYWLTQNIVQGTALFLQPLESAFSLSLTASTNYGVANGRIDYSFKASNAVIIPSVTNAVAAANVVANGGNFYGAYATAATQWNILYPGQISGAFGQIGAYVDAIWLNANIQLQEMTMFTGSNSMPNDPTGYALIKAALKDLWAAAINAGVIQTGVNLTSTQIALANAQAGQQIGGTLSAVGWFFQVNAPLTVKLSPPCLLWYCGAYGITSLNIASIDLQ
jgi:hypothetical protein